MGGVPDLHLLPVLSRRGHPLEVQCRMTGAACQDVTVLENVEALHADITARDRQRIGIHDVIR